MPSQTFETLKHILLPFDQDDVYNDLMLSHFVKPKLRTPQPVTILYEGRSFPN